MLTKEQLQQMEEPELRVFLRELLRAMKYQDVMIYHGGPDEQGKDLVFWKADELGSRVNIAVVVKAKDITGAVQVAGEVATQVQQCFGDPFLDKVTGESRDVHQVWVVSNKRIIKEAEKSIHSIIRNSGLGRHIRFIDGETLWELVEQHMPIESVWQKLAEANNILNQLDPHHRPQVLLTNEGIRIGIAEKFPGAFEEKPFTINFHGEFPDTPEGQAAREALGLSTFLCK